MTLGSTLPADIASNPGWLIHNFLPVLRCFVAAKVDEALYRDAAFLNNTINPRLGKMMQMELASLYPAFRDAPSPSSPAPYIFHVGHCGSTLISRALGTSPQVLPVREPSLLMAISDSLRELANPLSWLSESEYRAVEQIGLLAMERRFRPGQLPIVKMTSTCNNLLTPVLNQNPARKALFICQALEPALAGILRSQQQPTSDLRTQAQVRLSDWSHLTGQPAPRLSSLRPEQIAVISWMGNVLRLQKALDEYPDRILAIDFDRFLEDPVARLGEICRHFGLAEEVQDAIGTGYSAVAGNYSKDPSRDFSAGDRQAVLNKARQLFRSQISAGLDYADSLISEHGLANVVGRFIE